MATRRNKTARRAVPRRRATQRKVARPWTREEIAFMRKYYRKFETTWVARQLRRTVYSVRYKAVDLNIKKASPSIWKGNKGSKNAFRPTSTKSGRTHTTRRTTKTRRTTNKRRWTASTTRRRTTTRKGSPRRRRRIHK